METAKDVARDVWGKDLDERTRILRQWAEEIIDEAVKILEVEYSSVQMWQQVEVLELKKKL